MCGLKKIKSLFLPSSHSLNVSDKIKKLLLELGPDAKILDLGSGSRKLANEGNLKGGSNLA